MKKVYIIGIGMGNPETMTAGALQTIRRCDAVVGARRMVESVGGAGSRTHYAVAPSEIVKWLKAQEDAETAAVLMSGDTGFYSGSKKLLTMVKEKTDWEAELIPGISSLQYFCARIQMAWDDVEILSLHGRQANFISMVRNHEKVFFLTDKEHTPDFICRSLENAGMGDVQVFIGERLSYPEETLTEGPAYVLAEHTFDPLSVVLVKNPDFQKDPIITHGISDDRFIRGEIPMTKEEVRSVTISKLGLRKNDIIYDIGAGTGSVSVEMALQASEGQVYAIETKEEAVALIEENKTVFGADNLHVIKGMAPEALEELPPADKAFIGGSKGNMAAIVEALVARNPRVRITVNVIALESLADAVQAFREKGFDYLDVVQISAARAKEVGTYHLMMGQNPVFILTAQKTGGGDD